MYLRDVGCCVRYKTDVNNDSISKNYEDFTVKTVDMYHDGKRHNATEVQITFLEMYKGEKTTFS